MNLGRLIIIMYLKKLYCISYYVIYVIYIFVYICIFFVYSDISYVYIVYEKDKKMKM